MLWYHFSGQHGPASTPGNGPGGSAGGWAYSKDGFDNGASDDDMSWVEVLDRFFYEGLCTEGWDIWVDEVQVCWG